MLHHIHNFHAIYLEKLYNPPALQSVCAACCRDLTADILKWLHNKSAGIMSIAGFLSSTQFSADGSQRARGVKLVNKAPMVMNSVSAA